VELPPAAWHRAEQYATTQIEATTATLKARLRPMQGPLELALPEHDGLLAEWAGAPGAATSSLPAWPPGHLGGTDPARLTAAEIAGDRNGAGVVGEQVGSDGWAVLGRPVGSVR